MMADWICACHAKNAPGAPYCELCGAEKPASTALAKDRVSAGGVCPFDKAQLHANGWCPRGEGWPITRVVCPLVCDACREPLTWGGTCLRCPAYAPGDRYEYQTTDPDAPGFSHWVLAEKGPFVILNQQQQAHMAAEFAEVMGAIVAKRPSTLRALPSAPVETDQAERAMRAAELIRAHREHNAKQGVSW